MAQLSTFWGAKEVSEVLEQLPQGMENRALQAACNAAARRAAKHLKAAAPRNKGKRRSPSSREYGQLYRNIKTSPFKAARRRGQRGSRVYTGNAFWGVFLEYGTKNMKAQPWFRPTLERVKDDISKVMLDALIRAMNREIERLQAARPNI